MKDLVLPAFEMDCRDWLVLTPAQAGLPDEVAGLLDDELPSTRPVARDCVAAELVDIDAPPDSLQYVLATPDGALALLAEFTMPDGIDGEIVRRIEMLMKSFRWAV